MDDITAELNNTFDLTDLAEQVHAGFSHIVFVSFATEILWLEWSLKYDPDETKSLYVTIHLANRMGIHGGELSAVIFKDEQDARLFLKEVKNAQQETGVQRMMPSSAGLVFTSV